MRTYFSSRAEIAEKTVRVDINSAIALLREAVESGDEKRLEEARKNVAKLCPAGGPLIYCNDDGTAQVLDSDVHSIAFASTGKGKTRRFIYPSIYSDILAGTNFVVNDMKGEIYATTKSLLDAMGYETLVFDLRNPMLSPTRYNPLGEAWDAWYEGRRDDAFLSIRNFALCIFGSVASAEDPFWHQAATDYFTGIALGMLELGTLREMFTLENVSLIDREGERNAIPQLLQNRVTAGRVSKSWLECFDDSLGEDSLAHRFIVGTASAPDRTRSSITTIFRQPISIFVGHAGLMDALSQNDFTARSLTEKKTAVFVISPDETHAFGSVVVSMLNQLMAGLITIAQREYGGRLPYRVDFFLDEMGNLPAPIPDMEALVSAARSRNLRFHFVLQSSDQLANVYGEQLCQVILDNCDTWVYMGTKSLKFLEQLSELCGNVEMHSGATRRLLPVDVLQHLETRQEETETLVLCGSLRPYIASLKDIGLYETMPEVPDEPEQMELSDASRPAFPLRDFVMMQVAEYEREFAHPDAHAKDAREVNRPSSAPVRTGGGVRAAERTSAHKDPLRDARPVRRKADDERLAIELFHGPDARRIASDSARRFAIMGMDMRKSTFAVDGKLEVAPQESVAAAVILVTDDAQARALGDGSDVCLEATVPALVLFDAGVHEPKKMAEGVKAVHADKPLDASQVISLVLGAFLENEDLCGDAIDGALRVLERGEFDKADKYVAVGIICKAKGKLTRRQKDRVMRIRQRYAELGLTYKQQELLKTCVVGE